MVSHGIRCGCGEIILLRIIHWHWLANIAADRRSQKPVVQEPVKRVISTAEVRQVRSIR